MANKKSRMELILVKITDKLERKAKFEARYTPAQSKNMSFLVYIFVLYLILAIFKPSSHIFL